MLREMIKAAVFNAFETKKQQICEDLTGQRRLGLGAHW